MDMMDFKDSTTNDMPPSTSTQSPVDEVNDVFKDLVINNDNSPLISNTILENNLNSKSKSSSKSSSKSGSNSSSNLETKSSTLGMKDSDSKNESSTISPIENAFHQKVQENSRKEFLNKIPSILKKINNTDNYKMPPRVVKDVHRNMNNLLNKRCSIEKTYNTLTSSCNTKRTEEQLQQIYRSFDNEVRAFCQEADKYCDNMGLGHLGARDNHLKSLCNCLTEFNKDNCQCHIDLTEKLQIDNFIGTLLNYFNVKTEPDYDYTATIDKKYLFDKDICKLLENSCRNDDEKIHGKCTDQNENILRAC